MDSLSAVLAGHQANDVFALRCEFDPPWSVRIEDRATVGLIVMLDGGCLLTRDGSDPVELGGSDVAVVKGPTPYTLGDRADTAVQVVVGPGQVCRVPEGADPASSPLLDLHSWGNSAIGRSRFVAAAYELPGQVRGRLLPSVPDLIVVDAGPWCGGLVGLLAAELLDHQPGQSVMVDRYVDLILVSALRQWFTDASSVPPAWWTAQSDPVAGRVLTAIHADPARAWTLQDLAAATGYSRATMSRRFTDLVGQSPMAYLAEWRLTMAADVLRSTDRTVESVAHSVGYANAFAFSHAFKREYGQSPRAYRTAG